MAGLYKSPASRAAVLDAYARRLAALPPGFASQTLATRFGPTHLLAAGPTGAPPLLLLHGSNGSALDFVAPFARLAERHRCWFADLPGEPNRSSEVRPSKRDDSYGRWVEDLLDGLALPRAALLGMSLGGYVILKAAAAIPERVARAVLIAPEGLSRAPLPVLLRSVLWPLLRYRLAPGRASARRIAASLSAPAPVAEAAVDQLAFAFEHLAAGVVLGPLLRAGDLARCHAPVLLVAGARDVVFPGAPAAARARRVIPNLRDVILLPDANHMSADLVGDAVLRRIDAFLAEAG